METVSEGRDAINATKFVLDDVAGAGIKIAVLDKGLKGYLDLQNRGELPRNLTTVDFTNGQQPINSAIGDIHGSACAEIVYDIAPAAEMYLLKVDNQMNFQEALVYCSTNNIKIVSCSICLLLQLEMKLTIHGLEIFRILGQIIQGFLMEATF
jgi:hypothetical protein